MRYTRQCKKCGRNNWHENAKCAWCLRRLPTPLDGVARSVIGAIAVITTIMVWTLVLR